MNGGEKGILLKRKTSILSLFEYAVFLIHKVYNGRECTDFIILFVYSWLEKSE